MKTALEILNGILENFSELEKDANGDGYALNFYRNRGDKPFEAEEVQSAMEKTADYGSAEDAFILEVLESAWSDDYIYSALLGKLESAIGEAVMSGETVDVDGFAFSDWWGENVYKQTFPSEWARDRYVVTLDTGMTVGDFRDRYPFGDFSEIEDELDESDDLTFMARLSLSEIWALYDGKEAEKGTVTVYTADINGEQCDPDRDGITIEIADIQEIEIKEDSRYITEGVVTPYEKAQLKAA